jgi:hypothetical protein
MSKAFTELLSRICDEENVVLEDILRQAVLHFKDLTNHHLIGPTGPPAAAGVINEPTLTAVDANGTTRLIREMDLKLGLPALEEM